jgi:hypothetical protein
MSDKALTLIRHSAMANVRIPSDKEEPRIEARSVKTYVAVVRIGVGVMGFVLSFPAARRSCLLGRSR